MVDQTYRLVDEETGEEILVNSWREMIQRDELVQIKRFEPPSEADPLGRVWGERAASVCSFEPTVIRAKIEVVPSNVIPFKLPTREELTGSAREVTLAFGEAAAHINECLTDGSSKGLFDSVVRFVEVSREAELKAEEVDALVGGPPNFSTGDPVDDAINTALRGALRMTAAITTGNRPGTSRYEKAREELARGVMKVEEGVAKLKKGKKPPKK